MYLELLTPDERRAFLDLAYQAVEVDGEVEDVAAVEEAVGWCVGPSASDVYAYG